MKFLVAFSLLFFLHLFQATTLVEGKTWAVIVAGSNGWYNYRHQADACHAYQILHRNGIPDENIIVMMYDDIANNRENPTPGVIINRPNGPDVYHGVLKDYTGGQVTPKNFLNVLKGNSDAMEGIGSGKVINSGPDDDIFVYFTDHGAPGLIAFPGASPALMKKDLLEALNFMHTKNKYRKMVLYIEACESGSMFSGEHGLPDNINIYGTTAANPHESSYAFYYDKKRDTYLGDLYSIAWMEDSDKSNLTSESLQVQFSRVKKRTNLSHVQEYGDMSLSSDPLIDYQGEGPEKWSSLKEIPLPPVAFDAIPSPDVPLDILKRRLKKAKSAIEIFKIQQEINRLMKLEHMVKDTVYDIARKATKDTNEDIWAIMNKKMEVNNLDCHAQVVDAFSEKCYKFGKVEVALKYVHVLANLCETNSISVDLILSSIEASCPLQFNTLT